jgi:hypothetical protein
MKRHSVWLLGAAALVISGPAHSEPGAASQPGVARAPAAQLHGTLTVTGSYAVNKAIPNGTVVSVSVFASVADTVYSNFSETAPTASVANGKVTFKVSLPYTWLLKSAADQVMVTIQMSASPFGSTGVSYYYSNYDTKTIRLPKNGATTAVAFTGSL